METSFFSFASPSNQKSFILFIVNIGTISPSDKTMKVFIPFVAVFLLAVVPASCFGMPPLPKYSAQLFHPCYNITFS